MSAPAVAPGLLVAGRYRLESVVPDRSARPVPGRSASRVGALWRAHDDVLARPVAVLLVPDDDPLAAAVLAGAKAVAGLAHPDLAKVYDAGRSPGMVFVVTEYFDGGSLEQQLQAGPLEPSAAIDLVAGIADAVAAAHRVRLYGFTPTPSRVLFTASGSARLAGVALASSPGSLGSAGSADSADSARDDVTRDHAGDPLEAAAQPPADTPPATPELAADPEAEARKDTLALAHLLYATLTGRWPGDAGLSALPPAPYAEGHLCMPRQTRGGVPREADLIVTQVLGEGHQRRGLPAIESPAAFAAALLPVRSLPEAGHPYGVDTAPIPVIEARSSRAWWPTRRRGRLGLAAGVVVLGVAVAALFWPGETIYPNFSTHNSPSTTRSPSAPGGDGQPTAAITVAGISEFDPYGDGDDPHVAEAPNAVDGNPDTAWHTQTFTSADLGNLKPGVGLLVDLGRTRSVSAVHVQLLDQGADVELLESNGAKPPGNDKAMTPVADAHDAGASTVLRPHNPVNARYWLVWLTKLPAGDGGFRTGIAELTFES